MNGTLLALSTLCALGVSSAEAAAATNVALSADGAVVVSTSSATKLGDHAIMTSDLLTDAKTPWLPNGDTRYTFAANDPDGTIEIKLGALSDIVAIGAAITLPKQDRPVAGPVAFAVSLDGVSWTNWGAPVAVTSGAVNPISVSEAPTPVRYIRYEFGPTGKYFDHGGSAVRSIFADAIPFTAVPEPSAWAMMVIGFGALGWSLRRRNRAGLAA